MLRSTRVIGFLKGRFQFEIEKQIRFRNHMDMSTLKEIAAKGVQRKIANGFVELEILKGIGKFLDTTRHAR